MKRQPLLVACLLSSVLAVPPASFALTADNPYADAITKRNLFKLKAPPTAEELAAKVPPPAVPNVVFVGITTLMGGKRALLRVPRPARPPEPAREIPLILSEGSPAEEGVQVLEIDIATATVKINNQGTVQTLDLAKNGPKTAIAAPPIGVPVPPPQLRGGVIPMPVPVAPPAVHPGITTIGRPLRGGNTTVATSSSIGAGPSGLMRAALPAAAPPVISAEEQTVLMEVERERTKADVASGIMPPLPPTEITQVLEEESSGPPPLPKIPRPPSLPGL